MISDSSLDYRCKVPLYDIGADNREIAFDQPWLEYAIPCSNGKFENCNRYAPRNNTEGYSDRCSAAMFDTSVTIACSEFVYASDEKNVQTEFGIHCSDNYKLALIGTVGNIGRFIGLPIFGLLADKYGRLPGLLIGMMLGSLFALIKSFSVNYYMYIILEFFEASASSVCLSTPYILAAEWLNSKNRVLGNTIIGLSFPVGEMFFGLVAMYIHDFRILIRVLHIPGLFVFVYFWLMPESIRWLLVTGRFDRAVTILKRIAKVNRKDLSEKSIEELKSYYETKSYDKNVSSINENNGEDEKLSMIQSLSMIFRSKTFSFRFLICCYLWIACTFSYYGLGLSAMSIPNSNRYVNLIVVMASEIPGNLLSLPLLSRMKRRVLMSSMMFIGAISMATPALVPKENSTIVLMCFILGKASVSCAFTSLYAFTMEQWPSPIRNTVLNTCSMIGRIGSMVAPLTTVLATQFNSLPNILFAASAMLSSLLVLFCPETFQKKLPDTMKDAKNI